LSLVLNNCTQGLLLGRVSLNSWFLCVIPVWRNTGMDGWNFLWVDETFNPFTLHKTIGWHCGVPSVYINRWIYYYIHSKIVTTLLFLCLMWYTIFSFLSQNVLLRVDSNWVYQYISFAKKKKICKYMLPICKILIVTFTEMKKRLFLKVNWVS